MELTTDAVKKEQKLLLVNVPSVCLSRSACPGDICSSRGVKE